MKTIIHTRASLQKIAIEAKAHTKIIVSETEAKGSRLGYLVDPETAPELNTSSQDYPNITKNVVKVVAQDTYDAAIDTSKGMYGAQTSDFMPVCVLNFANAHHAGGGWEKGASAQEEQLFFRSTISGTLHDRFYPMKTLGGIYSPHVIIFRESASNNYEFMAMLSSPESLPVISVISIAAEYRPTVNKAKPKGDKYAKPKSRKHIEEQMRLILRAAGQNNHRRLVLGAIGCGAFGHPPREVATAWAKILGEVEFKGWFELIIFAVFDRNTDDPAGNYAVFKSILDGENIG
jgi:uncharacterized protein (TIGR02452 family)